MERYVSGAYFTRNMLNEDLYELAKRLQFLFDLKAKSYEVVYNKETDRIEIEMEIST